jgi:cytochrome c
MIRKLVPTFAAAAILAAGCSLIHPFGNPSSRGTKTPILSGAEIDPETLGLIQRACQNCHSFNTELPLYGRIAPMSWLMARDVEQARLHMNLSQWQEYSAEDRIMLLSEVGGAVKNREMPVQRYVLLHSEARLSDQERDQIYQWTRAERKRLKSALSPLSASVQKKRSFHSLWRS